MQSQIKIVEKVKPIHGEFFLKIYKKGKLIDTYNDHNLIVIVGRERLAHLAAGKSTDYIKYIGFGSGTRYLDQSLGRRLENDNDTFLDDQQLFELKTKNGDDPVEFDGVNVKFNFFIEENEAVGLSIRELGLFCVDGTMFTHRVRINSDMSKLLCIDKESDISIEGYYILMF